MVSNNLNKLIQLSKSPNYNRGNTQGRMILYIWLWLLHSEISDPKTVKERSIFLSWVLNHYKLIIFYIYSSIHTVLCT